MVSLPEILYKSKNALVVRKPVGMPSQSDPSGDTDLMSAASASLSELGEDPRLWLVHRLDRNVGGVIVFARTRGACAELSSLVSGEGIGKRYLAVCEGCVREGEYRDLLFKDSATGKAYIVKTARRGAKEALMRVKLIAEREGKSLVAVKLSTGRFHQIRAQLSGAGNSIVGDKKYGSRDSRARTPALFASRLDMKLFEEKISVEALPSIEDYPWSIFAAELSEGIDYDG